MPLNQEQGQALLKIAREALSGKLGRRSDAKEGPDREAASSDLLLQEPGSTFVTLKLAGDLRGCIGSLSACEPLAENVRRNAVNAGFCDPRFPPLKIEELDRVAIEVSVLTPACRLDYKEPQELLHKLRPGIDGVIIRKGHACATFLPQVWDQLPRPEDFLGHLCLKAGLGRDAWRKTPLEVEIYQVQPFGETGPER
jgi:AmmeMemoRadiSam system protein A